jgi:hypothetical protein
MTQLCMRFLPLWGGQAPKITKAPSLSTTTADILPVSSCALCALGMPRDHLLSIPEAGRAPAHSDAFCSMALLIASISVSWSKGFRR